MWAVTVDGFTRAEFPHYCDAVDFAAGLPGNESTTARITATQRNGDSLTVRLGVWRRERRRQIRKAKQVAKWESM